MWRDESDLVAGDNIHSKFFKTSDSLDMCVCSSPTHAVWHSVDDDFSMLNGVDDCCKDAGARRNTTEIRIGDSLVLESGAEAFVVVPIRRVSLLENNHILLHGQCKHLGIYLGAPGLVLAAWNGEDVGSSYEPGVVADNSIALVFGSHDFWFGVAVFVDGLDPDDVAVGLSEARDEGCEVGKEGGSDLV